MLAVFFLGVCCGILILAEIIRQSLRIRLRDFWFGIWSGKTWAEVLRPQS
jgi:hypothetical protein